MARVIKTEVMFEGRKSDQIVVVEREDPAPWPESAELSVVGKPHTRLDGPERVTGEAQYTYDLQLPGMLSAKILRCPYPHARIKKLDTSKAEALPGVRAVLTHLNAPRIEWHNGKTVLFDTELRFQGEEVLAVAADDEYIARDALRLVEIEYEQLPFVTDLEEALKPGAPGVVIQNEDNPIRSKSQGRGDVERGFADADVIVEARYSTSTQLHQSLETHGSVAHWERGRLTIWDSTQNIFGVRNDVADYLDIPRNKVRVLKKYMGGGFGSKNDAGKYTVIAALLSQATGRPVKCMLDRREESLSTGNRNRTIQEVKVGAKRDGTLTALSLKSVADAGAYGWTGSIGGPYRELYTCPNVRTEEWTVRTNTGPANAFRAPGYVEGTFSLESVMDELAQKLGMSPLDLRMKNYAERDPDGNKEYTLKELHRAYELGYQAIGWEQQANGQDGSGTKKRGIGMASQVWSGGGGPPAHAVVKIDSDGTATIISGTQDSGTGTKTMLAQVAAEELGMKFSDFTVELGDTQDMPYAPLSAGSMTAPSVSPAVRMAAEEARKMLFEIAGAIFEVAPEDLAIDNGEVYTPALPENRKSVREIMESVDNYMIVGKGSRGPNPDGKALRTFGAQFAEVEVDTETGQVDVLRVYAAHEAGRVINPLAFGSQIEGGVIQGMGFGVTEERYVDGPTGRVLNANLEDYKIPTAMDIPLIEHHGLEQVDAEANSVGAKGIGEPPIIPTAAAIANAVAAAIGVRVRDLPMTPARVLAALAEKETAK